jgi:cytochrome c-type biogenesis protein CcmH/NrfG
LKKNQVIAIVVAVVAAVLVISLPRTAKQEPAIEVSAENSLDAKVEEAVAIIQGGQGAPMQAITMLLDVLKEDPNHEKALLWLGNFSMMSGQWEKAVDRFHQLNQLHPENALYALNKAKALVEMGDTAAALEGAKLYLQNYPEATPVVEFVGGFEN